MRCLLGIWDYLGSVSSTQWLGACNGLGSTGCAPWAGGEQGQGEKGHMLGSTPSSPDLFVRWAQTSVPASPA